MTDWSIFDVCGYEDCRAGIAQPCRTASGSKRREPHESRQKLSATLDDFSIPSLEQHEPEDFLKRSRVAEYLREFDGVQWGADAKDALLGYLMTVMHEVVANAAERTRKLEHKRRAGETEVLDGIARYEIVQR